MCDEPNKWNPPDPKPLSIEEIDDFIGEGLDFSGVPAGNPDAPPEKQG